MRRSRSAPPACISGSPIPAPSARGPQDCCSAARAVTFEQAVEADADYLGVGPIWESPSKEDADAALGLDELAPDLPCGLGPRRRDRRRSTLRTPQRASEAGAAGVAVDPRRDGSGAAAGGR